MVPPQSPPDVRPLSPGRVRKAAHLMRLPVADFCRRMEIPVPADLPSHSDPALIDTDSETSQRGDTEQRSQVSDNTCDSEVSGVTTTSKDDEACNLLGSGLVQWPDDSWFSIAPAEPAPWVTEASSVAGVDSASSDLSSRTCALTDHPGSHATEQDITMFAANPRSMALCLWAPEAASYPHTTSVMQTVSPQSFGYRSSDSSSSSDKPTQVARISQSNPTMRADEIEDQDLSVPMPEEINQYVQDTANLGPCSKVWKVPAVSALDVVAKYAYSRESCFREPDASVRRTRRLKSAKADPKETSRTLPVVVHLSVTKRPAKKQL
jgi:hypothetical protein